MELDAYVEKYDFNSIYKWCLSDDPNIDCDIVLNIWNILDDIFKSIQVVFKGATSDFDEIYDKLFYGNNLECINETNEQYYPIFTNEEISNIKSMLNDSFYVVERSLHSED